MLNRKMMIATMSILLLAAGHTQAGGDAANGETLAGDCSGCHGADGMGDEDFPTIAGMEATKLAKALADFKSGARVDEDEMMVDYVTDLSDQDMADLAAYFSSLPGK